MSSLTWVTMNFSFAETKVSKFFDQLTVGIKPIVINAAAVEYSQDQQFLVIHCALPQRLMNGL